MRLYKFMPRQYAVENILYRRLKISRILTLNDPFEFAAVDLSDALIRDTWLEARRKFSEKFGLVSFCRKWTNPVIWAHYAEDHKGVCLGIDMPDSTVVPVKYVSKRVPRNEVFDELNLPIVYENGNPVWTTKFSHWRYEQEYRWLRNLEGEESEGGLYYMKFGTALKEVILGDRCDFETGHITEALGHSAGGVDVYRARPAFGKFAMTRQLNKRLAR